MKTVSGFCVLFLLVTTTTTAAAFMFFFFLTPTAASWFPDVIGGIKCGDKTTLAKSRKLKEIGSSTIGSNDIGDDGGRATLDDYNPIDPSPSWKQVTAGPIEHGSPLNPYIPKLPSPPPSHPNPGDYS